MKVKMMSEKGETTATSGNELEVVIQSAIKAFVPPALPVNPHPAISQSGPLTEAFVPQSLPVGPRLPEMSLQSPTPSSQIPVPQSQAPSSVTSNQQSSNMATGTASEVAKPES
jgi:hypothetical protein